MEFRAACTGAEEEIVFQQVRVARPAGGPRLRRGAPLLLVHDVLLLFTSKDLAEDLHTGDSTDCRERTLLERDAGGTTITIEDNYPRIKITTRATEIASGSIAHPDDSMWFRDDWRAHVKTTPGKPASALERCATNH